MIKYKVKHVIKYLKENITIFSVTSTKVVTFNINIKKPETFLCKQVHVIGIELAQEI